MANAPLPERFDPYDYSLTNIARWWGLAFEMSILGLFYRAAVEVMISSTASREEL